MAFPIRLQVSPGADEQTVNFEVVFAAPRGEEEAPCLPAVLETGDGHALELGDVSAPSVFNWREQRNVPIAGHTYVGAGTYAARLRWGEAAAEAQVSLPLAAQTPAEVSPPDVSFFAVEAVSGRPLQHVARLQVANLAPGQYLHVDGGAGQSFWLDGSADGASPGQTVEWTLGFSKPGDYLVGLDLLDADGFWLATLAEVPLEIVEPIKQPVPGLLASADAARIARESAAGAPPPAAAAEPWLPYRYGRPAWAWACGYTTPGGGRVSRLLGTGTCLGIREQVMAGDTLWYQTAARDWVPANAVNLITPSQLRGVQLNSPAPEPPVPEPPTPPSPPPPTPGQVRTGVTTVALNVRARPGASAANPPVTTLAAGTEVKIYEEQTSGGAPWYRIGDARWVHSAYVRLKDAAPAPGATRRGTVFADALNVRARPGMMAGNPPIGVLQAGDEVSIYEETSLSGAPWYRIGTDRWVSGAWVRLLAAAARVLVPTAATTPELPIGWVVSQTLDVREKPGKDANVPPIEQAAHNQSFHVYETRSVAGVNWYRIGDDRWVEGTWFGVANFKARPSSIPSDAHWVAVSLKEQTVVAYEGDRPIYTALAATGMAGTPTVRGVYSTWRRLETGLMSGGSPGYGSYYYLEDVTWTCYFYQGYSLHTAYWHDAFGRPRSHGCVNLSPYDAWWIYQWSAAGGEESPTVYVYW